MNEPVSFAYWPPDIVFSKDIKSFPDGKVPKTVDLNDDSQKEQLRGVVKAIQDDPSTPVAFDVYSLLGIPPNSFISQMNLKKILASVVNNYVKPIIYNYVESHFDKFMLHFYEKQCMIYLSYNTKGEEFPGVELNKIHLFPKNEYIIYCLLRLHTFATSLIEHDIYKTYKFKIKTPLFSQASHIKKEDTYFSHLGANGGITAPIVIYTSSDPTIRNFLLTSIIALFRGQEDTLGYLEKSGTDTLSPFNVRISSLITYSANDRCKACNDMLKVIEQPGKIMSDWDSTYEIPGWYKQIQSGCATNKEETNRTSQLLLGIDACDDGPIDYEQKCREPIDETKKYCFISQKANPLPAPAGARGGSRSRKRATRRKRRTTKNKKRA